MTKWINILIIQNTAGHDVKCYHFPDSTSIRSFQSILGISIKMCNIQKKMYFEMVRSFSI